jgi:hypothetical protein
LYAQPLCFRGKSGLGIAFTKPLPSRYSIYMTVGGNFYGQIDSKTRTKKTRIHLGE